MPPSNIRASEPADARMRTEWYLDLTLGAHVVQEVYGGSMDHLRRDGTYFADLSGWQEFHGPVTRCCQTAVRVWRGEMMPSAFPADGRDLLYYGFATMLAPRGLQPLCCMCSARRMLWLEPDGVPLGRGRERPLVAQWREGANSAFRHRNCRGRTPEALLKDLDRALEEVVVERSVGRTAEFAPRSHLRVLHGVAADDARTALASTPSTAAAVVKRLGKLPKVPQK